MSKSLIQTNNEKYQIWVAHHLTHIDNLPLILKSGSIHSYNIMRNFYYKSLANDDVQAGRSVITVSVTNLPLHDYVPLYLGFKTPMVAVNQNTNEDLLFLRFSLDILSTTGSVLCDGNARSTSSKFYLFNGPDTFSNLDITAIKTVKYSRDSDLKRKKQAEVLILNSLSVALMHDIVCHSESAKTRTLAILKQFGISKPVNVNRGWYFSSHDPSKKG